MTDVKLTLVDVEIPKDANVILGHSHFIKTAEDLYEALAESSPTLKFGLAFCEASGKRLIRSEGNDEGLRAHAEKEAQKIAAGHTFIIFVRDGYPVNVLNRIKGVSEVVGVFAATANPVQAVIAESAMGRGIMGVIDGERPLGVETEADKKDRKELLRKLGYKR
ncbi:MAG: adenosine-specific kinase [Candidatus ainarchaeum sp.]|nr:adenosine-specific kinase [Candidatus ainarchaeum sp.]MDD5096165.1 adenosine-specific kinase [Candidatus ainarchaeum sp.]